MPNITRNNIGRIITSKIGGLLSGKKWSVGWLLGVPPFWLVKIRENPAKSPNIYERWTHPSTSLEKTLKIPQNPLNKIPGTPLSPPRCATITGPNSSPLRASPRPLPSALRRAQAAGRFASAPGHASPGWMPWHDDWKWGEKRHG